MFNPFKIKDREPVFVVAFVQALLALLVSFGVNLTADQVAAILTFLPLVLALWVRSKVSPVDK